MKLNISGDDLDRVFAALAHPHRRALIERMTEGGEMRVTELARGFDVSLNQISKHLKVLEEAGILRRRREGREHHCSVDLRALMGARSWMQAYEILWRDSLAGLERYLDDTHERGGAAR